MPLRMRLRWAGWFAAANGVIFALVGLRFLASYSFTTDALGIAYGVLAYVSHFALLAALPVFLLVVPVACVVRHRGAITALAVLLSGLSLTLLVVDSNVFAEQRYHLTPLMAALFEPATWIFIGLIGCFALIFEGLLAGYVWRWVEARPARGGRALAVGLIACWFGGQVIHMWADAAGYLSVTQLTRYLPAYFPIHAKRRLARWGLVDPQVAERQRNLQQMAEAAQGQLEYPLHPLQCQASDRPLNVLVVLIDALRPDAIDPQLMPNLAGLRDQALNFANHWSGGNSSKAGLFAAFYGLPATYIETFYGVQQPPVLMTQIRDRGYELALFAAPGFGAPTDLDRTSFAGISGLPGERHDIGAFERNRAVTDDWMAWLEHYDRRQPFFGFLYYDPPVGEVPADPNEALPMDERFTANPHAASTWREYRLAARMVDGELGRVEASLGQAGLLGDTVLIVMSDHGYEFDDYGLGVIGHASDYSPAQVRATLVMRWPGKEQAVYRHRSSHYDLPVTLLQDVFGCRNDPADYSVGRNLFAGRDWDWIIAASYNSHAIVRPDGAIVTHPGGFVEVLGPDYRPVPGGDIDTRVVAEAMSVMRRYYR
jgi:membrane-anchored protein YejM (alkaline phosphatase superfamily)